MNLGVLGFLGRSFFCDLLTYHFHIYWLVFSSGVSFGFGPKPFPRFLAMNQAWELLWGDPFVDFHIIFYEVLLTSRWNSNSRVNPFTKVAGLHWKYGSRGKLQRKWFLVHWLLQAALDLRKNMEAKNPHRNEGWHILGSTHLHCLGFQNVNFPCFGSARFAAFIRLFNSNFTARALHQAAKTLGMVYTLHNQPHRNTL